MFKRILASFVGSLAAMIVAGLMFFVGFIMFIVAIAGAFGETTGFVDDHSILYLDLNGEIADRDGQVDPLGLFNGDARAQSFETWMRAISLAKDDPRIDGCFINCSGSSLGYASRQELIEALEAFKKSGKWVYAYGDAMAQGDYYVATVADSLFINPVGMIDVRGVAAHPVFYKNALDKLGIEMQVVKVGTFKSAVEPYILTAPSEASQLQTREFIGDIWQQVSSTIARNRNVTTNTVNAWADTMMVCRSADFALAQKAVDASRYRRQVDDMLRQKTDIDDDEAPRLVSPDEYLSAEPTKEIRKIAKKAEAHEPHFAVLYACGEITDYGKEGIVGDKMCQQIIDLADDENVLGMVLRVNSPGGSAFASEQIWEALQYFKSQDKPLYVSMGDYAASGGYYISCGADKIFADANTLTGSIGIFGLIPCASQLFNDKLGINTYSVATNPQADFPQLTQPLTDAQHAALQDNVERGYKLFTSRVAKGRNLPIDKVLAIAEGRVWTGARAQKLGLVDEIGSLQKAREAMAKKLNVSVNDAISYPILEPNMLNEILVGVGDGLNEQINKNFDSRAVQTVTTISPKEIRSCLHLLQTLQGPSPLQARMPYVIVE